ncbi:MAG: MFS transporter [Erysipelotrichaceae bacterium]|nr:MFS transporter [Erysipelotrichaceae bacterium]
MKFKLTKQEKAWILYDIGNSAFILLVTTIVPIYFNSLAGSAGISNTDYLAYWGYATSIATLLVVFIGPIFGTLADTKGFKKPIFTVSMLVGALGCTALGFTGSWIIFLVIYIIAKVGYSSSLVFYDSMLPDITTDERMDHVSSYGYAWGYIGSCIPFVVCLVLVLMGGNWGLPMTTAMTISFCIIGAWWIGITLPLLKQYKQKNYVEVKKGAVKASFGRLWETLKQMSKNKKVFFFLIAFFCYIDGVYTIIDMATAYGQALGLDTTGLLLALLVTQVVAWPFSILFGRLSKKYDSNSLITICICAYTGIAFYALFLVSLTQFWILAVCVGMFQGAIQALSRSYFAKIIPAEKSGEYFGIYDICGKGASFLGTTIMGLATQLTGNANVGIAALSVLFIVGLFFFRKQAKL